MHDLFVDEHRWTELVDPWLGRLVYRADVGELVGSIEVEPAIRRPRLNGERDLEILFEIAPGQSESSVRSRVLAGSGQMRAALERLAAIKLYAVDHAPPGWVEWYGSGTKDDLLELLFLDGMEVDLEGRVSVHFDFEDLDQLVVSLDDQGRCESVALRSWPIT